MVLPIAAGETSRLGHNSHHLATFFREILNSDLAGTNEGKEILRDCQLCKPLRLLSYSILDFGKQS